MKKEKDFFEEFEKEMQEIIESMMDSMPQVYGFSMQIRNGVPRIQHFGNLKVSENGIKEPFTSSMVDEKSSELKITSEMPGTKKEDIKVNATEDEVTLEAEGEGRKYFKRVNTHCPIEPESAKAKYNNGVLEVTFKQKKSYKGKQVIIE